MINYVALDLETYLINGTGDLPKPVCASFYYSHTGRIGVVGNNIKETEVGSFSELYYFLHKVFDETLRGEVKQIWQNGFAFDLPVIWHHYPTLRDKIIEALDRDLIHDTHIREKLYRLSTIGEVEGKRGTYSLAGMAKRYLAEDLTKWKTGDDIWRLRYSELDGVPSEKYPKDAIEYAKLDVQILWRVFQAQEGVRNKSGPGSMNTENLQIRAGFALSLATNRGLAINKYKLETFENDINEKLDPLKDKLLKLGFATVDKKGQYGKANKKFIEYLETNYPEYIKRTEPTDRYPNGEVKIDDSALGEYPADEVIKTRMSMSLLEKYKGTYLKNIKKAGDIFRESYDVLKNTGRTSSFIQTMPRDGGIRELFKARKGYKLITIDYSAIEACSIAQTFLDLSLGDTLVKYLNRGESPRDYHAILGHMWHEHRKGESLSIDDFERRVREGDKEIKRSRQQGKPAGLSIAGGVGNSTMVSIAKGQGIILEEEQAAKLREFAYLQIPEFQHYLGSFGWVSCQKVTDNPHKAFAYEVNGRYRNYCTYAACANGRSMQSPAADGAKEAIWLWFKQLYEWGDYLVLFIHDELGAEVKDNEALPGKLEILAHLMCKGMQKVLKKVRISVEGGTMDVWSKDNHETKFRAWRNPTGEKEFVYERL